MGKWLPESQVFIEKNQQYLRTIPVAYFAVGLTVADGGPDISERRRRRWTRSGCS